MRRTLITILTVMMVLSGTLTAVAGDRTGGKHRDDRGVVAAETQKGKDGKRGAREPKTLETGVLTERAGEPDPVGSRLYNVTFRNVDDAKAAADKLAEEYDLKPTHVYRNLFKGMAAKMSPVTARKLAKDGRVKSMEQARKIKLDAQTMPTGINRIDADQNPVAAIDGTDTRVDVDVMVIDELAAIHNDLNVVSRGDCVDGSVSGNETGIGHGTHVSGTIAALDNGIGVVGVAPGARIWSVNVFDSQGYGYDSYIACALDLAAAPGNDIEVVNMSLGGYDTQVGGCNENLMHAAVCRAVNAGVTVVVAAGNESTDARYSEPANYPEVIAVSALEDRDGTSASDKFASFSNYGSYVDIAAPGVAINSTMPGNSYGSMSGTSMASPHVAGAAALYLSQNGSATPAQVKTALLENREQVAMSGDPDGINEGILNVRNLNSGSGGGTNPTPSPTPSPTPNPVDTTPPTVTITSPTGSYVTRNFTFAANAKDASGIAKVEFWYCVSSGCSMIGSDASAPYSMRVSGPRGNYTLFVRAYDNAGNTADSTYKPITIRKR